MNKEYTLIVQDRCSLSNETDAHPQSDYSPGIWSIKTQKSTLKFARQILGYGDKITRVTIYENPNYAAKANYLITELGLDFPLFQEPEVIKQEAVTNGKPSTLGALKRYLAEGTKIKICNFDSEGTVRNERETFVKKVQSNNIVLDKNGGNSWLEFGKASEWNFTNETANHYWIGSDGKRTLSTRITYITQ